MGSTLAIKDIKWREGRADKYKITPHQTKRHDKNAKIRCNHPHFSKSNLSNLWIGRRNIFWGQSCSQMATSTDLDKRIIAHQCQYNKPKHCKEPARLHKGPRQL